MRDALRFRHSSWALVTALLLAYVLSFLDRQILGLLVDGVKRDLNIDDVRMSLLLGPAFGVFYAVLGMPCGWLADRVRRTGLIAAGLLVWSAATFAGGLAHRFPGLAATRMLVGVGEAALVPAAVSLIADRFPAERRALPLAIFTAGIALGAGLALIVGGALVGVATHGSGIAALDAWLGSRAPWRSVLMLAGLAGLPLALAVLAFPEPARVRSVSAGETGLSAYLWQRRALFAPLLAATSLLYILSNAFGAWLPSLLIRGFGWDAAAAGTRLGGVVLVCALAGTLASGGWATALARRGRADAGLIVMTAGAALLAPAAILAPLGGSAGLVLGGAAAIYAALALVFGVATASLVAATPASLRGRMVALYLLLGNLAGLGLGPPAVGLIVEHGLRDPAAVGTALALVALATAPLAVALLMLARRRFVPSPDNG